MKKIIFCLLLSLSVSLSFAQTIGFEVSDALITKESLASMPIPEDFKTYYILQSFEGITNVVIGDFSGAEKKISLIIDNKCDGTMDEVWEYYPESRLYARLDKPTTPLYTSYPQIKNDIIEGKVFNKIGTSGGTQYTHAMASLPDLKRKIKEGRLVSKRGHDGRYVRIMDPDQSSSTMADFYFGKESGLYDLQFKTNYNKSGAVKVEPLIKYSVFAKGSNDPVIKEYVEALLKEVKDKNI